MSTLTNARRFLIASAIPTADLTNEQIINRAIELGFNPPDEKPKAKAKPKATPKAKTKEDAKKLMEQKKDIADEISIAIRSVLSTAQTPPIDETQIVALIEKHAHSTDTAH
jgi:hypothetical protein